MNTEIIEKINAVGRKAFLTITGGGTSFIGEYLSHSGGSKTIGGFYVPYSQALFDEFVGCKPDSYANQDAANKLAMASFIKAKKYFGDNAIGIGGAFSLVTPNERVGREHKFYVSVQTMTRLVMYSLTITQDMKLNREQEEIIASELIFTALRDEVFDKNTPVGHEFSWKEVINVDIVDVNVEIINFDDRVTNLTFGPTPVMYGDTFLKDTSDSFLIFPGSFNPIHDAHIQMMQIAEKQYNMPGYYEISIQNVDKAPINVSDLNNRLNKILESGATRGILSNTPTMYEKMKELKTLKKYKQKLVIVVGYDTLERIFMMQYYKDIDFNTFIGTCFANKVEFFAFGRKGKKVSEYVNTVLPEMLRPLVKFTDETDEFNLPISSTDLRKSCRN